MMKRNAIARTLIASAVLAVVGVAQAGSLTVTKRTVANEAFGTAATLNASLPNITYTFNTPGGIVVNPSGAVQIKFVIAGGTWSTTAALAAGNVVIASLPTGLAVDLTASSINTAGDTLTVSVSNTSTANVTIGIGGTVTLTNLATGTFQANGITQGTPVTVTGAVYNGVNVLEAATAASTVVDYAQAVTLSFVASTETTRKIDLTATPAGSALTASSVAAGAGKVQLGKIKATNNATVTPNALVYTAGSTTEVPIVANSVAFNGAGHVVTITPGSGAFTAKQSFALYTAADCSGAPTGGAAVQAPTTGALTAATTSVTLTSTGGTQAQYATDLLAGVFVCSDYSTIATNGVISTVTPSISAVFTKGSTSYTGDTLSANNGYALGNNGQTVDVRSYIPKAVAGYTSFVRVINTGTISAAVSGQWLYEDGTSSTAAVIGTLASGGAKTFTSTEIEAALGAPTATIGSNRPRIRLTAPTSGLQAQSFFLNPDNSFSTMHGAD